MIDEESVFDHVPARDVVEQPYDPDRPDQSSPEWADYVMGQFLDSELNLLKSVSITKSYF